LIILIILWKLLIMQFSLTSCLFIPLWSRYPPQYPAFKHPKPLFLP
jgi:putative component of membrane protein insertase Oxa1/YidC/SpoIIIJ protein YidD